MVNQSLGHRQGDLLLMAVANLLYSTIRPTDMVARMAGDEFALLLEDIRDIASTLHVVNRIQQKLVMPFMLDKHEVYCTVSFGIAADSDKHPEELLGDANIAMIGAKALGGGGYVVFDKQMHDQAVHRLELEMDLRRAVERDEFSGLLPADHRAGRRPPQRFRSAGALAASGKGPGFLRPISSRWPRKPG